MYHQVIFSKLYFYHSLGLLKVNDRQLNPKPYTVQHDDLSDYDSDVLWLRSFTNEHGRISYGIDVTFYNGDNYRTIEVVSNVLHCCDAELLVIQRVVRKRARASFFRKSVAAIQCLSSRLPLDLVVMCLPWNKFIQ